MTLSDPRRALLPLALALACAIPMTPVAAQGLRTSFEPGEPAPAPLLSPSAAAHAAPPAARPGPILPERPRRQSKPCAQSSTVPSAAGVAVAFRNVMCSPLNAANPTGLPLAQK